MSQRQLPRAPREPDARSEVMFVRVIQLLHRKHTAVDESLRTEKVIAHQALRFRERWEVFPAQAKRQCQVRPEFPVILDK